MAAETYRRGDRLRAETVNRILADLDREDEAPPPPADPRGLYPSPTLDVRIHNGTADAVEAGHILGIKQHAFASDVPAAPIVLEGETPAAGSHKGRFAVLHHYAAADEIVPAAVAGVVQVKVEIVDEDHRFAEITDADATKLTSAPVGSARILWAESGTGEKWAVVRLGVPAGLPPIYKATADQSGDTVMAKRLMADGTLASGDAEELDVYSDAWKVRTDDLLILTQDADDLPVAMPIQGCDNAFTVPAGSSSAAETTTWDIDAQPSGYGGVLVEQWFRLYWSGTSGDPVYQFTREAKYDSKGALLHVGPEVRSVAFGTDTCE
jgi:hypothetical protein